jgi:hypothetical protein
MSAEDYAAFLAGKCLEWRGIDGITDAVLPLKLFDWQAAVVRWALRKGRAAIWADTGLGKTAMQLAWAQAVAVHTNGRVLILTPLAVGAQTVREAAKFGVRAVQHREGPLPDAPVIVLNYERLHHINPADFTGVVLDESSILKSYMGATKRKLLEAFAETPYRLCCTATPAPNDHLELGNHCAFLGIMPSHEMIMRWFINDPMEAGAYRLKAHGAADFWRWVASWALSMTSPTDLGYDGAAFVLPPLRTHHVDVGYVDVAPTAGQLFVDPQLSATQMHATMRQTAPLRAARVAELIAAEPDEPWLIFSHTNYDADALVALMPDLVDLRGSDSIDVKEQKLVGFSDGSVTHLLSKPSIVGFGMNFQFCARVAFLGVSYSFEQFYQAIRRTWRFGQTRPVDVYVVSATNEYAILNTLTEKAASHQTLKSEMLAASREAGVADTTASRGFMDRAHTSERGERWELITGDCVPAVSALAPETIQLSVFSPPFSNLYVYSDAQQDMGNSTDHAEFLQHYGYLAAALLRATVPGRICAVHCKDLPLYKGRDGAAGLYDFPGALIRTMTEAGWTYHSRVTIWKDPVIEMQRTKNHGLLYKQLRKDSCASRQGMADYVLAFRKWTDTPEQAFPDPVPHERADFPLDQWQAWASPVWDDIQQTNVLKYQMAKESEDSRHICPLQLEVIERCVRLWSNPGDFVLSPFAGIGSEGYEAVRLGRRFIGVELKESYAKTAAKNLRVAETLLAQGGLFHAEPAAVQP